MIYNYFGELPLKAKEEIKYHFFDHYTVEDLKDYSLKKFMQEALNNKRYVTKILKENKCEFFYKFTTKSYIFQMSIAHNWEKNDGRNINTIISDVEVITRNLSELEQYQSSKDLFLNYTGNISKLKYLEDLLQNYDNLLDKIKILEDKKLI